MSEQQWKLVPVDPTAQMEEDGCQGYLDADGKIGIMHKSSMGHAYRAMLAAAPQPPALGAAPSDQPSGEDSERASFELIVGSVFPSLSFLRINRPGAPVDGEYENPYVESRWLGWIARAALAEPVPAVRLPKVEDAKPKERTCKSFACFLPAQHGRKYCRWCSDMTPRDLELCRVVSDLEDEDASFEDIERAVARINAQPAGPES